MTGSSIDPRAALSGHRRIVVKIGSRSIIGGDRPGAVRFQVMADQIADLRAQGYEVILVSSGAVALGLERLGLSERPGDLSRLQCAAAVGQCGLIHAYEAAFREHELAVAQVLLTHDGMENRRRYLNARAAIDAIVDLGAVPIINENDTVSTQEIEFGDNDQLAAMVATLAGADLLILLTDVVGLLDERRQRISIVPDVARVHELVWPETDPLKVSLGGMASKLGAAERALQRGLPVVIAPAGLDDALMRVIAGEDIGTLLLPVGSPLPSRKHWIAHTLKMRGRLVVDAGAERALVDAKRSLLPAGIVGVEGDFQAGDAVSLLTLEGRELARGLARYGAPEVRKLAGARSHEIQARLGRYDGDAVVHRDDLVVL
ncbi:MAG: glutamate 5-kinase [Myxococcales bacterium]|nr:glutamate 5-kinase [Myxococcales bacterium]MDD9970209.1 glutamate 5-kinase [Myxococcales bacterium]